MRARVIPCFYNQSDPMISKLGDLKVEYAATQSVLIRKIIRKAENLIIFKAGDIDELVKAVDSAKTITLEEKCFVEKIKRMLV